jgi:hypothetical protein
MPILVSLEANTLVLDLTGKTVSVFAVLREEYKPIEEIAVATVETAYECPQTGKVYVLMRLYSLGTS